MRSFLVRRKQTQIDLCGAFIESSVQLSEFCTDYLSAVAYRVYIPYIAAAGDLVSCCDEPAGGTADGNHLLRTEQILHPLKGARYALTQNVLSAMKVSLRAHKVIGSVVR